MKTKKKKIVAINKSIINEIYVDICENILIDFDKMIDNSVLNGENVFKPEIETREKAGTKAKARQDIISINKQILSVMNDYHTQKLSMSYAYYKIEQKDCIFKNRIFANIARKCQLQVKKTSM